MEKLRCSSVLLAIVLLVSPALGYNLHEGIARSTHLYGERAQKPEGEIKLNSDEIGDGMFVGLNNVDHYEGSPLYKPEATYAERIKNALERSHKRVEGFRSVVNSGITPRGVQMDSDAEISSKASFQSPVTSSPGSYIMEVRLGTPPQTKTAIVDTGSDLCWLQCAPCQVCYSQPDPLLDPRKSSSYKRIPYSSASCAELPQRSSSGGFCSYRYGYGDQSTTQGDLATETLTLTTTSGAQQTFPNFVFGCGYRNQGTFGGTDGLIGLGRGDISLNEQLGSNIGYKFAYCLVEISSAVTQSSPLILGEAAASVGNGLRLQYTPLVKNPYADTFYYVKLNGINVNNQAVKIPSGALTLQRNGRGGIILDSGTTLTYLIQSAYTPFLQKVSSAVEYPKVDSSDIGLDLCFDLSGVSDPTLPTVTFQFQGVTVVLPPNNVFLQVDEQGTTCLAFAGTSDLSIIGNIQQQNFYYLYDIANERVGIAPVDSCAALGSRAVAAATLQKDEL